MGDFVQENKRFLVSYLVGALVFLVAWLIIGALFNGDIERNQRRARAAGLAAAQNVPDAAALQKMTRGVESQRAQAASLAERVNRKPSERFSAEGRPDPDLWYNEVRRALSEELLEPCARLNIEVDGDLGTPDKYPSRPSEFHWYLRGLDVVDQVLRRIIDYGQTELGEGIARVERIEIQPPGKRVDRARGVYSLHPVDFVLVGHPVAVSAIVESLGRPENGRLLALQEARIHSLDRPPGLAAPTRRTGGSDVRDRGRVEARLRVAAVDVELGGPAGGNVP